MWQLQGIDSEEFVRHYWQKKPCLIRNAFDNFETPVSPEELAGLACEEEVHCRLVIEKDGESPWQLRYGPFAEEDFLDLPDNRSQVRDEHHDIASLKKRRDTMEKLIDRFDDLRLSVQVVPCTHDHKISIGIPRRV